jgi:hypothetical protein
VCKNRLTLHSVAILAIVLFAFLALSSATTKKKVIATTTTDEETAINSVTTTRAVVHDLPSPGHRPFDTLGLVFATSVTKFDENEFEIYSQEGIVTMLLREAQKLGGNDILNLRADENVTVFQTKTKEEGGKEKVLTTRTVTVTGSALAIKYRNDATPPGSGSSASRSSLGDGFVPQTFSIDGIIQAPR